MKKEYISPIFEEDNIVVTDVVLFFSTLYSSIPL